MNESLRVNALTDAFGIPSIIKFEDIDVGDDEHSVLTSIDNTPSIDIFWQLYEHRCPNCNNVITDYTSYEFMLKSGECLNCDHVRGEINDYTGLEAQDVLNEMTTSENYGMGEF